jgi:hypothetical protein
MKKLLLSILALLLLAGIVALYLGMQKDPPSSAAVKPADPPVTVRRRPAPKPLPPASLRADVDGDGVIDSLDDERKRQGLGLCVRPNDNLANGVYDDLEHGDDDLQEFELAFGDGYGPEGRLWVESTLKSGKLRFFRSRIATVENEIAWPLELRKDAPAPKKLYMLVDMPKPEAAGFELRLVFGRSEKEVWNVDSTTVTVAARIGDPGYFMAARRYIVQNRARLFLDQAVFHRGEDGLEEGFAWAIMRAEATRLQVIDAYNGREKKLLDIGQVVAAFPGKTVIVNGGSVWDADGKTDPPSGDLRSIEEHPERHMTKMSNGGIISGGVKGKGQPYRHRDGRIIDSVGYIGWSQAGGFEFGVGAVVPSDRGYTEGLGGLLPGASYDRTRCGMVGQVAGGAWQLVLVANTDLDHRINGREDNGSGKGATAFRQAAEASAGPGNLTLYFRDSAASVGFAHRGPDDVLRVRHAGFRHTVHQPSIIHNYLAFECALPAIQGQEPAK